MNQTIQNLAKAFIGESQARNRYTLYSKIAKDEGYVQIASIFNTTAEQEKQHAKWLFRMINDLKKDNPDLNIDEIKVEASAPTIYDNTLANLKAAIAGENYEYASMYPKFADMAIEEGYPQVAGRLRSIAKAEQFHEERYNKLLEQVENNSVFKKAEDVEWVCSKCGFVHKASQPPEKCPSCSHPMAYFELKCLKF